MSIKLGQKAKCKVTGFVGVAICRASYIHGVDRIDLQPPIDKDGKLLESEMFDEMQLTVVDEKCLAAPKPEAQTIELGQLVRDRPSQIEGIAHGTCLFLNGCRRILISPKKDKDGKHIEGMWFDQGMVSVIEEKIADPVPKQKQTGGPVPSKPHRNY